MADISNKELKTEITSILKNSDLSAVSAKKVREQIEKKLKCSLLSRKKEFDKIVVDFVNEQQEEKDSADKAVNEGEVKPKKGAGGRAKKRPQPTQRKTVTKKKKMARSANDSSTDDDDSDYEAPKKRPTKQKTDDADESGRNSTGICDTHFRSVKINYNLIISCRFYSHLQLIARAVVLDGRQKSVTSRSDQESLVPDQGAQFIRSKEQAICHMR